MDHHSLTFFFVISAYFLKTTECYENYQNLSRVTRKTRGIMEERGQIKEAAPEHEVLRMLRETSSTSEVLKLDRHNRSNGTFQSSLDSMNKVLKRTSKYGPENTTLFNEKKRQQKDNIEGSGKDFVESIQDTDIVRKKEEYSKDDGKANKRTWSWSDERKQKKSEQVKLWWKRRREKGISVVWTKSMKQNQSKIMKIAWKKRKQNSQNKTVKTDTRRTWMLKHKNGTRAKMMYNRTWGHWNRNQTKREKHAEFVRNFWRQANRTHILERLRKQFWNQTNRRKEQSEDKLRLFWRDFPNEKRRFIVEQMNRVRMRKIEAARRQPIIEQMLRERQERKQKRWEAKIKQLEEKERKRKERADKKMKKEQEKAKRRRKKLEKRGWMNGLKQRMADYWSHVRECERRLMTPQSEVLRKYLEENQKTDDSDENPY
uniref:Uncharacterized protein n=1 Tax=Cacopsylla melanoneura TaxID=428564 RepID=A0A8D9F1H1_9HEMI